MAIDPNPTPRPQDPFTAQDAARAFASLELKIDKLIESLGIMSGTLANILNKEITTLEQLSRIEEGLSGSRIGRLEQEIREAELEREVAEAALRKAEDKLRLKSEVKEKTVDTQEHLRQVASSAYQDLEKQRRAEIDAKIQDLKWTIIKTLAVSSAIGIAAAIGRFLWFLVETYNRGAAP